MGEKLGYVRVSTDHQNTERQDEIMKENGIQEEHIFREKIGAKNMERPELKRLMAFVRKGDTVFVESYSRIARNTRDLLDIAEFFHQKGVEFISIKEKFDTGTTEGKFLLTVFAGLAEMEREIMLDRQREGIEIAKQAGRYVGRKRKEIADIEEIYEQYKKNECNISQVAKKLHVSRGTLYQRFKEIEKRREYEEAIKNVATDDEIIDFGM